MPRMSFARYRTARHVTLSLLTGGLLAWLPQAAPGEAATPNVEMALKLTPTQRSVEYDQPTKEEAARCTLSAIEDDVQAGWLVRDPSGQTLRRFIDSNRDNVVDQWCYFKDGVEVYRDIDSDFNRKADQYRWLNTAGRRWGLDRDEDGRVDSWRSISAQEVTAEAVEAIAQRDAARFSRLLLTAGELQSLGLGKEKTAELSQVTSAAETKFRQLITTGNLPKDAKWIHFSATQPGVVPAGTDGSTKDLVVYENVVTMVEHGGKPGLVQIGTLVRVDDRWRLIDAPAIPTSNAAATVAGFFFRASPAQENPTVADTGPQIDEKLQKLLGELERLQRQVSDAAPSQRSEMFERMAALLEQLVEQSQDPAQRTTWLKQLADSIGAAVQGGDYPRGVQRLEALTTKLQQSKAEKDLVAYVRYRRLLAAYSLDMQDPKANFAKIQQQWLTDLEEFVDAYPDGEDSAEAMLQLAMAQEFAGEEGEAKRWYTQITGKFGDSPQAKKAAGAKRRIDSVGQVLSFRGQSIRGKTVDLSSYRDRVVVLQYWATWCEPCKDEMATLQKLVDKYGRDGFSVIGINVDQERSTAAAFLAKNKLPWETIFEPGGLDGRPAAELGVLTLPTMLLVDPKGRVVNRNAHASELEDELKKHLVPKAASKRSG